MADIAQLQAMQNYFNSGATQSYAFRKAQLKKLKQSILAHEEALYEALYKDLKKCKEECWATETGLVMAELNTALKHLKNWMEPERVRTTLVNQPSSSYIMKEPLGVVLIIGTWNYPVYLLLNPLIGAVAAGNAVVLKPSESAAATAAVIKKIIEPVFPKEYILYAEGDGATVVPAMMNSFTFAHVFFTGSTIVGKIIYKMAAERLVPVTLELGGKSPCIVESDADIQVAARRIAIAKFSNAGQMCVAPDYVLVHASVKETLLDALKVCLHNFFGDRAEESYNYCRIINEKQFNRLSAYLSDGSIATGGRTDKEKLFIEPTVLTNVPPDAAVMNDEIFGPILPVIAFSHMDEAMAIISRHPNPLSFYIYTASGSKEKQWLQAVPAGGACVNNSSWHLTNHHLPFGGRGFSGIGNYHGKYSFDTFSHKKAVMKTPAWFDPSLKYPPFKGKLKLFKWVIG